MLKTITMKNCLGLIFIFIALTNVSAQTYCNYNDCIFWQLQTLTVEGDTVNYATSQWSIDEWNNVDCNFPTAQCENLGLEVYYPPLPQGEKRPLVMLIHGGGFIGGSRADFRQQAITIAQLGYVTATIDYRLCKRNNCLLLNANPAMLCNLSWASDFAQSAYVAMHDGNAALKFLKQNSEVYHIDTNNIIVGGHSAGALTAMLMSFTDQAEANSMVGGNGFAGLWGNIEPQQGIKGVFCLSGAAFDTTFIDANENIPTFIVHGTCDPVVCYGTDAAFHCNGTYPDLYGGADIALRMAHLNHNYYLYTGQDMGHDVGTLAGNWLTELLYFMRKNVLCGEAIQKHSVVDLNPDSGECATLEGNTLPGHHTRYSPAALTTSAPFGNLPTPCSVGVNEKAAKQIKVYPNPAQNFIRVDVPEIFTNVRVNIYTIQGQKAQSIAINKGLQKIDISGLGNGLYLLVVEENGQQIFTKRIVVEK